MQARTGVVLAATGLGVAAIARQQLEAQAVRRGRRRPLGPDGQLEDEHADALHRIIAGWHPARPATSPGRVLAALWASPLTLVGVALALLGGRRPTLRSDVGCLVATDVGGPMGAFLAGQGAAAATLGQLVVAKPAVARPALLAHEVVHVRQQERLGPLFALAYPLAQVRWGYRANPFEVAARRGAADPVTEPAAPS